MKGFQLQMPLTGTNSDITETGTLRHVKHLTLQHVRGRIMLQHRQPLLHQKDRATWPQPGDPSSSSLVQFTEKGRQFAHLLQPGGFFDCHEKDEAHLSELSESASRRYTCVHGCEECFETLAQLV
jgi:hypothetical protein